MPQKETVGSHISAQAQQDLVSDRIENFELPKSLMTKIAKSAIPENTKLQKETVLLLVKGSTVFINYLAATAHDVAVSKEHKSISASDVLKALELIEFGDLAEKIQPELIIYRQQAKTDKMKKGPASASVPAGKAKPVAPPAGSVSAAPSKSKGKDKAVTGQPLPLPFTSTPLGQSHEVGESASSASRVGMEVDWEGELGEAADAVDTEGEPDRGGFNVDDVEDELEDDKEDVDEDEGETPEDPMEVEKEETRKDVRGLDAVEPPIALAS